MWYFALLLSAAWAQASLDPLCEQGNYTVTGIDNGLSVKMNYSASGLSFGSSNETLLTLVYQVPTMYFYDKTIDNTTYDRAVQITFHDQTSAPAGDDGSCYSGRAGSSNCPSSSTSWTVVESGCMSTLTGVLNFDDLMRNGHMDDSLIAVREEDMTLNGVSATPTWEIYLDSMIETWAPYKQVSDDAGNGNLDFNGAAQEMPDDHLTIETELHQFYHIPFRISIPQQIEITATSIRSSAELVALYAIIDQRSLEINFNTSSGAFGVADLIMKTQVQFPYALIGTDATSATGLPTIERVPDDVPTLQNIDTIEFTSFQDGDTVCTSVPRYGYCEQEWGIRITPKQCDISGIFKVDFYAECFTTAEGCALNFGTDAYQETSNRWTGIKYFTITAQEFCPTVLDEITVQGIMQAYEDSDLSEVANPGVNTFVNDHVYFETTFTTTSTKDGITVDAGDDSIIQFVRPYRITMTVELQSEPLQYIVETANGDVTYLETSTYGTRKYMVELCSVTPLGFDYTSPFESCYSQKGWNAINTLAFTNLTSTSVGANNTIDPNEIAFSLRLDERVIPVDHPNDPSIITIDMDVEIYYNGVTNPARRRLSFDTDGDRRVQSTGVRTTMSVQRRPVSYCPIKSAVAYTGFKLTMLADSMVLPTTENIQDHVFATRHQLSEYLNINPQWLRVFRVARCVAEKCSTLFPEIDGELDSSAPNTVTYYIDVRDGTAAHKFQNALYNSADDLLSSPFMNKKALLSMSLDHCDSDLLSEFNEYRIAEDQTEIQTLEDSSAAMFSFFLFGVLALLY